MSFTLFGLGTALPAARVTQAEGLDVAQALGGPELRDAAWLPTVYAHSGIDTRHQAIGRPVLGTEASLGSISRETVIAYYRARYVPSNMVLVVMGDFDAVPMHDAVRRTFGAARKGRSPAASRASWPEAPRDNVETADLPSPPGQEVGAAFPFDADPWDRTSHAAEILLAAASVAVATPE